VPELTPAQAGGDHTKRCHLANPDEVWANEVLPEIGGDMFEEQV
jgi:peptide/nickel transport system ATP-binding protein